MVIAIVFAGGSGKRMGADIPKQFIEIAGGPVLAHTLRIFQDHSLVDSIILVANRDFIPETKALCERFSISKVVAVVAGGDSAQDSIYNGLVAATERFGDDAIVLLHDGVRPYVKTDVISAVIDGVKKNGNAITYTPCYETIVLSKNAESIDAIPSRGASYTAQAPQGFILKDILAAHERVRATPEHYDGLVDQATLYWKLGLPIHLVRGNRGNIKITTPEDIWMLEALMVKSAEINK